MNLIKEIKSLTIQAFIKQFPEATENFTPASIEITQATQELFGHYQCNSAMKFAKVLNIPPRDIANKIKDYLLAQNQIFGKNLSQNKNEKLFAKIEVAGPGFLNITLNQDFLACKTKDILSDARLGVPKVDKPLKVIVDYSCPNIAKEMHVGHLRSTIIGDCLARLATFLGHDVLKLNHIGDWGTQFGMLIAYLKEEYSDLKEELEKIDLSKLMYFYKASKAKFDTDPAFKTKSQQEVVKLQSHEEESIYIWKKICEISRVAYQEIYNILNVSLVERGESFYNPMLNDIVAKLEDKGLITLSEGAKCVYLEGFTNREGEPLPLIVQKSDGGFNYATTDLAAIYHRVHEEKANWIIYVTDAGQSQHFNMVFEVAKKASFYNPEQVRIDHVPFGLVLREDGKKFKTRSGDTEKLIDLLNKAVDKAKIILKSRNEDIDKTELEQQSKILGINAIKYADLSNNRLSNYKFSYEKMLQFEGNTAAFLSYAYVRSLSIKRKVNIEVESLLKTTNISLDDKEEINLALHILQFPEMLDNLSQDLYPHRLAEYLYKLAEKFHNFFHNCRVEGHAKQNSRLLLCEATAKILEKGFDLMGLTTLEKM